MIHFSSLRHRFNTLLWGAGLTGALSLSPSAAEACGGFFCSASNPVNQAAERMIFAKGEDDSVTMIVEIMFEGDAERFAWVLPVPGTPEVGLGSSQVFDRLQAATNPQYNLQTTFTNDCNNGGAVSAPGAFGTGGTSSVDAEGPRVTVLDQGTVGPFVYETISVDPADQDPADVAIDWLTANDYDVDALGGEVLRPYLANGMNLIAVKLVTGASAGSIRPISLTYQGAVPSIPIRPTAVAANEDMGVMVWVLGTHRAIPKNYYALELNELLIDWFNANDTYNQVVTEAANEAGGKGFVTEFAGPAATFEDVISPPFEQQGIDQLRQQGTISVREALTQLTFQYGAYDGYLDAVRDTLEFREGVTAEAFVSCVQCYFDPGDFVFLNDDAVDWGSYDPATDPIVDSNISGFLNAVETTVLGPIEEAAALFGAYDKVTRLYTTMSADEMTKDPEFDFNPDAEDVDNIHTAERVMDCGGTEWRVTLPDGHVVYGEGNTWPISLENRGKQPFNALVLEYSTSGKPKVITDNRDMIDQLFLATAAADKGDGVFRDDPSPMESVSGGGCSFLGGAPVGLAWVLGPWALLGWLVRRRRH